MLRSIRRLALGCGNFWSAYEAFLWLSRGVWVLGREEEEEGNICVYIALEV